MKKTKSLILKWAIVHNFDDKVTNAEDVTGVKDCPSSEKCRNNNS